MNNPDIFLSLETAKKLVAAGWWKPSSFVWVDCGIAPAHILPSGEWRGLKRHISPALTAEEILRETAPSLTVATNKKYPNKTRPYALQVHIHAQKVVIVYQPYAWGYPALHVEYGESIAEAAAQMWLWWKGHYGNDTAKQ